MVGWLPINSYLTSLSLHKTTGMQKAISAFRDNNWAIVTSYFYIR